MFGQLIAELIILWVFLPTPCARVVLREFLVFWPPSCTFVSKYILQIKVCTVRVRVGIPFHTSAFDSMMLRQSYAYVVLKV
uniref:Putative secreted protein n=1 Tax=Anopheles darlingi TaxID=43151 RepID=A0A2M4DIZ7_ANODA